MPNHQTKRVTDFLNRHVQEDAEILTHYNGRLNSHIIKLMLELNTTKLFLAMFQDNLTNGFKDMELLKNYIKRHLKEDVDKLRIYGTIGISATPDEPELLAEITAANLFLMPRGLN